LKKKLLLTVTLLLIFHNYISAKTIIDNKIMFTPYFSYKSKLAFKDSNRYTESYASFGINTAMLFKPLILELFFESGKLTGISKSLNSYYDNYFPDKGERSIYSTGFLVGISFLTHYDNFFIISLGVDYTFTSSLVYEKTDYNIKFKKLLYSLTLSDRFLLFKDIIMYTGVRFSFNKDKDGSPLYEGYNEFNSYLINLMIGFTFWL